MDNNSASNRTIAGSVIIFISSLAFGTMDSGYKYGQNAFGISETQMMFIAYVFSAIASYIMWYYDWPSKEAMFENQKWYGTGLDRDTMMLWIRSNALALCLVLYYYSAIVLPIGDQNCLFHLHILFTNIIAHYWLGEELLKYYILVPTLLLSVIGVVLVSQPSFIFDLFGANDYQSLSISAVIIALMSGVLWSVSMVMVRVLPNSHFHQLQICCCVACLVFWVPLLMLVNLALNDYSVIGTFVTWKWGWVSVGWPIFLGALGVFGFSLNTVGYQLADATQVSWIELTLLLCSFVYQCTLFNDIPNKYEIIGAVFLVSGCLLVVFYQLYQSLNERAQKYTQIDDNDQEAIIDETPM